MVRNLYLDWVEYHSTAHSLDLGCKKTWGKQTWSIQEGTVSWVTSRALKTICFR